MHVSVHVYGRVCFALAFEYVHESIAKDINFLSLFICCFSFETDRDEALNVNLTFDLTATLTLESTSRFI